MKANDNSQKPESLYYGDMRLNTLHDALKKEIYDRVGGQGIPLASVLGLLDILKYEFMRDMSE